MYIENPKTKGSGIVCCIPQVDECPIGCDDCFYQSGRSFLEPLNKNLPNIPSKKQTKNKIVRMNDGNDSNVNRKLVMDVAEQFDNYFYNTSMPLDLEKFNAPVVLTTNPAKMTDKSWHKVDPIPNNLMFVRFRVNMWNLSLLNKVVEYYTKNDIPVVITYMAYYTETINETFKDYYTWSKRILNSYYVLKNEYVKQIIEKYENNLLVKHCGKTCKDCGICISTYFRCKEKMGKI